MNKIPSPRVEGSMKPMCKVILPESAVYCGHSTPCPYHPKPRRGASHVVWTLTREDLRADAVWSTDGVVLSERVAVENARDYRDRGIPAMALMLGTEPKHLHPSQRPAFTVGP